MLVLPVEACAQRLQAPDADSRSGSILFGEERFAIGSVFPPPARGGRSPPRSVSVEHPTGPFVGEAAFEGVRARLRSRGWRIALHTMRAHGRSRLGS